MCVSVCVCRCAALMQTTVSSRASGHGQHSLAFCFECFLDLYVCPEPVLVNTLLTSSSEITCLVINIYIYINRTVHKTLHPVWNETLEFDIKERISAIQVRHPFHSTPIKL